MRRDFKRQKERYGVDQAQFHFPPAISFLRLHAPDRHGDHQDQFRPMVVAVNRDRFSRKESAIAGTGPGIFGVTPMTDAAGEHIGSFELGMNFGPLLHALKAAYRLEMALFIDEQALRQLIFAEGLNPDFLTEENRRGKYIKFHSTNWALMKELVGEGDLSGPAEAQYTRSALDVPYGVVLLTLFNNAGDPIGKVAMARDFSSSRAAAGRSLVWQGLLALSAIVLLAGIILIVVRGLLLRPLEMLSQQFVKLAEGRRDQPIAETEILCDEMQALAQAHEQLRTKPPLSADTDKKVSP